MNKHDINTALEEAWEKDGHRVVVKSVLALVVGMVIAFMLALIVCR